MENPFEKANPEPVNPEVQTPLESQPQEMAQQPQEPSEKKHLSAGKIITIFAVIIFIALIAGIVIYSQAGVWFKGQVVDDRVIQDQLTDEQRAMQDIERRPAAAELNEYELLHKDLLTAFSSPCEQFKAELDYAFDTSNWISGDRSYWNTLVKMKEYNCLNDCDYTFYDAILQIELKNYGSTTNEIVSGFEEIGTRRIQDTRSTLVQDIHTIINTCGTDTCKKLFDVFAYFTVQFTSENIASDLIVTYTDADRNMMTFILDKMFAACNFCIEIDDFIKNPKFDSDYYFPNNSKRIIEDLTDKYKDVYTATLINVDESTLEKYKEIDEVIPRDTAETFDDFMYETSEEEIKTLETMDRIEYEKAQDEIMTMDMSESMTYTKSDAEIKTLETMDAATYTRSDAVLTTNDATGARVIDYGEEATTDTATDTSEPGYDPTTGAAAPDTDTESSDQGDSEYPVGAGPLTYLPSIPVAFASSRDDVLEHIQSYIKEKCEMPTTCTSLTIEPPFDQDKYEYDPLEIFKQQLTITTVETGQVLYRYEVPAESSITINDQKSITVSDKSVEVHVPLNQTNGGRLTVTAYDVTGRLLEQCSDYVDIYPMEPKDEPEDEPEDIPEDEPEDDTTTTTTTTTTTPTTTTSTSTTPSSSTSTSFPSAQCNSLEIVEPLNAKADGQAIVTLNSGGYLNERLAIIVNTSPDIVSGYRFRSDKGTVTFNGQGIQDGDSLYYDVPFDITSVRMNGGPAEGESDTITVWAKDMSGRGITTCNDSFAVNVPKMQIAYSPSEPSYPPDIQQTVIPAEPTQITTPAAPAVPSLPVVMPPEASELEPAVILHPGAEEEAPQVTAPPQIVEDGPGVLIYFVGAGLGGLLFSRRKNKNLSEPV
ncbi:hypothetical protein JW911_03490 [Candidatus Peregrinibacteria bacterium]|nr:hypothetical protein [Candidatus Peregrinibacteria bacterium]